MTAAAPAPVVVIDLPIGDVVFRKDLYPRIKHDPALVQRYAATLEVLPPIEVNQQHILIDGWHRWNAHRTAEAGTIRARITQTASDNELLALAVLRNAAHGWQMDEDSKRSIAIRLYGAGTGLKKDEIARVLSVPERTLRRYVEEVDRQEREKRDQRIADMYMACYTQAEVAAAVGLTHQAVSEHFTQVSANWPKVAKVAAAFDDTFEPPLFNIWSFGKKTNEVDHYGNSEQRIVENLLYLYTEPEQIVVDPFAGGGSTIDVCLKRGRRYWVSDRAPIAGRDGESQIRAWDIKDGMPPLSRWGNVALVYLDPPYWKQAAGKYSKDADDLANMPREQFTTVLVQLVKDVAGKLQAPARIALLISPTQWPNEGHETADHIADLLCGVKTQRLTLEQRFSCPYSTEQYNGTQVEEAKRLKLPLVLTRELIVWRVVGK